MLYMTGENLTLIVLETENLESLKQGRPARTPDGKILIAWTPDAEWLSKQIAATDFFMDVKSTLSQLPDPESIHRELREVLAKADALRKLFRAAQRAKRIDGKPSKPREGEAAHA